MPGKYVLKRSRDGKFMFNLCASNGEVILTSQRYTSKAAAKNGIQCVKECGPLAKQFEQRGSRAGHFVLKARNGRVVGSSEKYNTTRSLENGMKSVRKNARGAKVDDQT